MSMLRYRGLRKERVLASAQHHEGRFHNPAGKGARMKGKALPLVGEYFFGDAVRRPPFELPVLDPREGWQRPVDTGLRATWLGHSTVLLEIDGVRVLTDPVFGERASPLKLAGPRRFHRVPATIAQLPSIDLVVLSHDHYDHLCSQSVVQLAKRGTPIVTALGVGARLEHLGVPEQLITELDWGESHAIPGLVVHATPSQHFSGRGFGDRNRTLWASWVIETGKHKVFFSGDTGLTEQFRDIADKHGPFDLTMLEIGAFHPSWGEIHLGPDNALTAFTWLGGGTLLPVHWGTFDLGLHSWNDPGDQILELAAKRGARVITPKLGAVVEPSQLDGPTPWWQELGERVPAGEALPQT
jgi:L-ascorbate metabolism protein UlaG (beta-lactamase superfamily)